MIRKTGKDCMESRRHFLKTVGVGTGGAMLLPVVGESGRKDDFPSLSQLRAEHDKQGIISPEKTYRMMEWEFHTPPEETFGINLEAAIRASRDAGTESQLFYTQDHWGHCFYFS